MSLATEEGEQFRKRESPAWLKTLLGFARKYSNNLVCVLLPKILSSNPAAPLGFILKTDLYLNGSLSSPPFHREAEIRVPTFSPITALTRFSVFLPSMK